MAKKKTQMSKKRIADKEVRFLAKEIASYKGPKDEAVFEMMRTSVKFHLREDGATCGQLKKFDQIVESAPIVGGSFNSSDTA